MDRVSIVEENFLRRVAAKDLPKGAPASGGLSQTDAVGLFQAQCLSRALDLQSRQMQKQGQGFYTIGSSGHEGMAAIAWALRPTDTAFLHYRDAAFQIARSMQVPGQSPAYDMLLSFACSSEDPISGDNFFCFDVCVFVVKIQAKSLPNCSDLLQSMIPPLSNTQNSKSIAKFCDISLRKRVNLYVPTFDLFQGFG